MGLSMACFLGTEAARAATEMVDDLEVHLTLRPVGVVQWEPMHGKSRLGWHRYHVIVAAFNKKDGTRVADATIRAKVSSKDGGSFGVKRLELMDAQGKTAYGNFFSLHGQGPYRVQLEISRPGTRGKLHADFLYDLSHETQDMDPFFGVPPGLH